jgi:hypothetical protein
MKHIKLFENFNQDELIDAITKTIHNERSYFERLFDIQFNKYGKNYDDFISWFESGIDLSQYDQTLGKDDLLGLVEGLIGRFLYQDKITKRMEKAKQKHGFN